MNTTSQKTIGTHKTMRFYGRQMSNGGSALYHYIFVDCNIILNNDAVGNPAVVAKHVTMDYGMR